MKKSYICSLALAYSGLSLSAADITADVITDGVFQGAPGAPWDFNGHWRKDGSNQAVYDALNTNDIGWSGLTQSVDLSTNTAFTSDADYDVNTTLLTGFVTNSATFDAYFPEWAEGRLNPVNAYYELYWEIDLSTAAGDYRLKSNAIVADEFFASGGTTIVNGGDEFHTWSWLGGSYLGDLTAASNVTIASITDLTAKIIMYAGDTDETQTATAFWLIDNVAISANVTTVPEPATYTLLAGMLAFASIAVRRHQ